MSKNIIRELFYNFVESSELPRKYYLLTERVDDTTKKLNKSLNKKNKKKLERLCNDYEEILAFEVENAFGDGFSLAVQLMSEAFGRSK